MSSTSSPRAGAPAERSSSGGDRPQPEIGVLARGGTLALVGVVASGALQLLLVVAVTRGLGAAAAGVFFEAVALFMVLSRVGEAGASTGLVRTVPRLRALGRTVDVRRSLIVAAWPVAIICLLMGILLYAFAGALSSVFFDEAHEAEAAQLIRLLSPLLPLASATTVGLAATRGFGKMLPYVLVQNVGLPAARLVLVLAAIFAGLGSVATGLAWALPTGGAAVLAAVWLIVLLRRTEGQPSDAPARPVRELASSFWRFSAPRGLAGILGMSVTWMDVLLVGALRSTREAAIYAAASRLAIVGAYALQAIGMAIAPRISALLARDEREQVEELYRTATWWVMALVWPLYAVMAVFAPFVMGLFGPEFVAGQTALVVLCLAMLVNLATGNVTTVLLMGGKSSWNLYNAAGSLALNVALNLLLTPSLGITGAAIAWAASLVFVNVAPVVQVGLFLGMRPPFGAGFVIVAASTAACYGGVGFAIREAFGTSLATFAVFVAVSTAIYLALLWRFRETFKVSDLLRGLRLRDPRRRPTRLRMAASPADS
ncbi:MAG: polysaccharide biosynthesis C-terminal domain-containing protein [Thermoleophilaceae bacterium]|nr:polysaccharide biosynthesis C-terminal domain-containing protein [Thermoleophilaceae bacterium]